MGGDTRNPFSYYKPDDSLIPAITEVREAFKEVYDKVMKTLPTRERAIAITKLEEAAMWAIKGIVLPPVAMGTGMPTGLNTVTGPTPSGTSKA